MAAPKKIDYERLLPDWRAGLKSPAQMAEEYEKATGVSCTGFAISKHFRKLDIPRDLGAKIKAKADALVAAQMVAAKVANNHETERAIVDANAETQATIRLAHRRDIGRYRALAAKLIQELEAQTGDPGLFDQLFELMSEAPEQDDSAAAKVRHQKLRDAFDKALSLPGRQKVMKDATEVLRVLVAMEVEAYGIAAGGEPPPDAMPVDKADLARRIVYILSDTLKASK